MYDRLIFYNHFGAGDIFESREFVKGWMERVPAKEYFYAHGKHPHILLDMPEIQFKEVTVHMDPMRAVWDDLNGNLYVNTWIGRDGRYVLPGIGCTVEKLFQMHNDMLDSCGFELLDGKPYDYIPQINYREYNIAELEKFAVQHSQNLIYWDNGLVQSNQAKNFDFNPIVEEVAKNHKDYNFILTHKYATAQTNIHFISDYTGGVGFDLNEASFISLFCDMLIGRNSGPHVFTQVKPNIDNPNTKLLSFTYHEQGSSFVVNTDVKIKKFWSSETSKADVIRTIERYI